MAYVIRWARRKGEEVPVVRKAMQDELRYGLGRETAHEAVESALRSYRARLEQARRVVSESERCVAELERLLAEHPTPPTGGG